MWVQNNYSPASDSTYSCCNGCGNETPSDRLSTLDQVADIPEEEIWLQKHKERSRPARLPARRAALHASLSITTPAELHPPGQP